MIDLLSIGPPSWFIAYQQYGQKFEIELINQKLMIIWNAFSPLPDVLNLDKPWQLYKRFSVLKLFSMYRSDLEFPQTKQPS